MLEPDYHTTKFLKATESNRNEKKKTEILMKKPVNLRLSIVEFTKILIYEFRCDYLEPRNAEKFKLCYLQFHRIHKNR